VQVTLLLFDVMFSAREIKAGDVRRHNSMRQHFHLDKTRDLSPCYYWNHFVKRVLNPCKVYSSFRYKNHNER
jgi:hypothetical protein